MGLPVGEAAALGAGGSGSAQLAGVVAGQALQGGPIVVVAIIIISVVIITVVIIAIIIRIITVRRTRSN